MGLKRGASLLWRWLWLLVLGTVVAAGAAYYVSSAMPRIYEASTRLLINQAQTPGTVSYNDILTSERLTKTYAEIIGTQAIMESTIAELKLAMSPAELGKMVSVQIVRDTMLLNLRAQSTDPQQAADIANAVARAFIEDNRRNALGQAASSREALSSQLESIGRDIKETSDQIDRARTLSGGLSPEARQAEISRLQATLAQYQLTYSQLLKSEQDMRLAEAKAITTVRVIQPAQPQAVPVSPRTTQNTLLAALVGLMLAVGVVLLISYLDDTVKSDDDLARAIGAPALGFILRLQRRREDGPMMVSEMNSNSQVVEAFRVLRTNLQFTLLDRPGRAILLTSAAPAEGKTTMAVNLAQVMAQAGARVILVDADLRRPTIHSYFGLKNDLGLTAMLLGWDASGSEAIRQTPIESLRVVTSGPLPPNPSELLGSARMADLVESLKAQADVVLFDSPPALAVSDPGVLANWMDAVLLVVDSGRTGTSALERVRETLERAGAGDKLVGAVLNKLSPRSGSYYNHYYKRYGHELNEKNGRARVI